MSSIGHSCSVVVVIILGHCVMGMHARRFGVGHFVNEAEAEEMIKNGREHCELNKP